MLEISRESYLLWGTLIAIVGLVLLITKLKLHPFIALILAAGFLGLVTGMQTDKIIDSFQKGFGGVLGFVAVVIGLGTMLGKMMAASGGTERIATTLINRFGKNRVHWAMMLVAFIVGIPVFFEVGFVLLVPLVFSISKRLNISLLKVGIPLAAGLSVVHGLVPPHPAPILAISAYKADVGMTIFYGLLVGFPTAVLAGPVFGNFISKHVDARPSEALAAQLTTQEGSRATTETENRVIDPDKEDNRVIHKEGDRVIAEEDNQVIRQEANRKAPGFGISLFTVLLPVGLMLLSSLATITLAETNPLRRWMAFIGNPITALLIALLFAFYALGFQRGLNRKQILDLMNESLLPIAGIILIIGGGGGFKQILVDSGVGDAIAKVALASHVSPLLLAWLVAGLIRVATGSATVAMITAAGIMAPIAVSTPGINLELLVLATGAGSLILSHVNDAGFWLVKEYYNMSVPDTLKTWTVMETLISVIAICLVLLLNLVV
jgi:GntP family gluconate:H+ symporter